ncbi:hypothetical protein RND81_13G077400 [Saponaria officinalis]|uniref:Uncharacterized protein n=1 Tax=Saponaria officinalis TaxID=3572 RepID=A0AAW1H4X1_SAPOF
MTLYLNFQCKHCKRANRFGYESGYFGPAWTRLCKCLRQDFPTYICVLMVPLLHSAQLKPNVSISNADSDVYIYESNCRWDTVTASYVVYFHEEVRYAAV